MAKGKKRYYGRKTTKSKKRKTRSERTNEILAFAYNYGLIQRGLNNSESRISKAVERGKKKPEHRPKSTLY